MVDAAPGKGAGPSALGVGLVYVPGCEPLLEPGNGLVDIIEIEPQTLWRAATPEAPYSIPTAALDLLCSFPQPKVIHSVGDAIGGQRFPDSRSVTAIKDAVEAFNAAWFSEHLSVTQVTHAGRALNTGFMLPPLQTEAGAQAAARNIQKLGAQVEVPLLVETGVNYLRPTPGELPDGEFVAQVVQEAQCGLLLDLHNVWTNERNGRQSVTTFLQSIPLESVWELHLAGGFELDGYWLDAHSGEVPPALMELASELVPRLPNLRAITFEIFPSFFNLLGLAGLERELRRLRELWQLWERSHGRCHRVDFATSHTTRPRRRCAEVRPSTLAPADWENTLGALVVGVPPDRELHSALRLDPGVVLMQKLVSRFRAGAIAKSFPVLVKLLLLVLGRASLEQLLATYVAHTLPERFALEEARGFAHFLTASSVDIAYLSDVLAYEEAQVLADLQQRTTYATFHHEPRSLLGALAQGQVPRGLERGAFEVAVEPLR